MCVECVLGCVECVLGLEGVIGDEMMEGGRLSVNKQTHRQKKRQSEREISVL